MGAIKGDLTVDRWRVAASAAISAVALVLLLASSARAQQPAIVDGEVQICSGESCETFSGLPVPSILAPGTRFETICGVALNWGPPVVVPVGDTGTVTICGFHYGPDGSGWGFDLAEVALGDKKVRLGEWVEHSWFDPRPGGIELQVGDAMVRFATGGSDTGSGPLIGLESHTVQLCEGDEFDPCVVALPLLLPTVDRQGIPGRASDFCADQEPTVVPIGEATVIACGETEGWPWTTPILVVDAGGQTIGVTESFFAHGGHSVDYESTVRVGTLRLVLRHHYQSR